MLKEIPVLLISFNRPEQTLKAIENLELFKPKKIYFSVDGPRKNNVDDIEKVIMCQNLSNAIKWDCEIIKIFSNVNHGAGVWPFRSISEVLAKEKYILIMEDDVRISPNFYEVLKDLLIRYENNPKIFAICALNINSQLEFFNRDDYFFTKYFSGWGWAAWADKWKDYQFVISKKDKVTLLKLLRKNNFNPLVSLYFYFNLLLIHKNKLKAWDYQINHLIFKNDLLNIKMFKNLSNNEGIGVDATHTSYMPKLEIDKGEYYNLRHPTKIVSNSHQERMWRKKRIRFVFKSWIMRIFKNE